VHEHDGFFLRFGLGVALMNTTIDRESTSSSGVNTSSEFKVKGAGAQLELLIGGTPAPGVVIGGALIGMGSENSDLEINGNSVDLDEASLVLSALGVFANWYFDPSQGFHAQVIAALGQGGYEFGTSGGPTIETDSASGYALGVGVGYDFWVGEQWSVGGHLRYLYFGLTNEDNDLDETWNAHAPSLSFVATLH
jgi:opacity protein-like surface antigen